MKFGKPSIGTSNARRTCKKFCLLIISLVYFFASHSQLAAVKMIGKYSSNSKLGFGVFTYWDIPVNDVGNRSVVIELMDLSFFPPKNSDLYSILAYLSIKLGYKYIFSEESKTGFYLEPSAGYCRVVSSEERNDGKNVYGDGIAAALEGGYSLEVGQNSNTLNFGLKFERDMAGSKTTVNSIGLRFSYSFHLFRKRRDY